MPYCTHCGKDLSEQSRYCSSCGASTAYLQGTYQADTQRPELFSEEDYIAFIGQNADRYIQKFRSFRVGGIDNFAFTWHWPAFFLGFWWMLYRKLYLWALVSFVVALIPYVGFLGMVLWGLTGNYIYYRHVTDKIRALRQIQPHADLKMTLSQIGGVNRWVAVVAVLLVLLVLMMALALSLFTSQSTADKIYYL